MARPTLFEPGEWGLAPASPHWLRTHHFDPVGLFLYERHYSARQYQDGRVRKQFVPPGEKIVLVSGDGAAVFVWHRSRVPRKDGQEGVCCTLFRNEGPHRSSALIAEAEAVCWARWPASRLFTYVDPEKVRSPNPGYCFKQAGWRFVKRTRDGKHLLERRAG